MLGTFRRAVQVKMLETRKKKLETRRDVILASLVKDAGPLYRHEYPNTPVLEDLFLELEYLEEALSGRRVVAMQHAPHAESQPAF